MIALTKGQRAGHAALRGGGALILGFLVLPLLVVVPLSFTASSFLIYPLPGLSLRWYQELLDSAVWRQAFLNTAAIALATTLLATGLGTLAAFGLTAARFPGRRLVVALLISPMFVPIVVTAVGTFYFYASVGLAASLAGIVFAHTVLALPLVVLTVTATLAGYDPTLSRAGASLGATPLQVFRWVTLPTILPGVVSGALFAFAVSLDEVVVTSFLGGPQLRTLPKQIMNGARENLSPTIAAVATVLILLSVALMAAVELLRRRGERLRGRPA